MIASKTYTGLEGTNYIQGPELAMTTVYAVKREGVLYEKYISGSSNRTHVYAPSEARVYFPINFNAGGEKVFVLYKETSAVITPVPVCVQVSVAGTLPNGIVGVLYSYVFSLGGTAPFSLTDVVADAEANVSLSGSLVTVSGTFTSTGTKNIQFTVNNCSAGTETVNQSFDILAASSAITITNNSASGVFITAVGGIPWTLYTGSFPLGYPSSIGGVHGAYTGVISVTISGMVFTYVLKLYKNGSLLQAFPVNTNTTHNFASQIFLSTDTIQIVLE